MREALLGGFAGSRVLDVHGQRIIDDNYAPGSRPAAPKRHGDCADTAALASAWMPPATPPS